VVTVAIPARDGEGEVPFAATIFSEEVVLDGPQGAYRFQATMERGGAPVGGETTFLVADPAEMPQIPCEVVLWGADQDLQKACAARGIAIKSWDAAKSNTRQLILVGASAPAGGAEAWKELTRQILQGSSVVFLAPQVFREGDQPTRWLPLQNKGSLPALQTWLYHKDDWAKRHPVFAGLPAGGMLDYAFYRELIPDLAFVGQDPPHSAIAGANNVSFDYSSGLNVAEYRLGAGRFLLNTLLLRENLGRDPLAERIVRNLLCHAAPEATRPPAPLPADLEAMWRDLAY
jgi:hypothetical protein